MGDDVITGGHAAAGRKRKSLLIGAAVILAGAIAFLAYRHWTAMPAIVAPSNANMHVNDVVLSEAAQIAANLGIATLIASEFAQDALKLVNAVIDATPKDVPVDPDAYAVKLVCLYQKGWILGFGGALTEARFRGVSAKDMLANPAYKDMLEKDKVKKKLPEKLRERLLAGREHGDTDSSSGS